MYFKHIPTINQNRILHLTFNTWLRQVYQGKKKNKLPGRSVPLLSPSLRSAKE